MILNQSICLLIFLTLTEFHAHTVFAVNMFALFESLTINYAIHKIDVVFPLHPS